MTRSQGDGSAAPSVEHLCRLAQVGRAGYYRHWMASQPRREETALRDVVQRLCLANGHYGYRRIGALLRREGWCDIVEMGRDLVAKRGVPTILRCVHLEFELADDTRLRLIRDIDDLGPHTGTGARLGRSHQMRHPANAGRHNRMPPAMLRFTDQAHLWVRPAINNVAVVENVDGSIPGLIDVARIRRIDRRVDASLVRAQSDLMRRKALTRAVRQGCGEFANEARFPQVRDIEKENAAKPSGQPWYDLGTVHAPPVGRDRGGMAFAWTDLGCFMVGGVMDNLAVP